MMIAKTYLENAKFLDPSAYFSAGGTLAAMSSYVTRMIEAGCFAQNELFRIQVSSRFEACIQHFDASKVMTEGMVAWIWRKIWGNLSDEEIVQQARAAFQTLSLRNVHSIMPELLFAPERSLNHIIYTMRTKVFFDDVFADNQDYREKVRHRLYCKLEEAWREEVRGIQNWAMWFFYSVVSLFWRSTLQLGFACLKHIDGYNQVLTAPDPQSNTQILVFENAAWLTDADLYAFATQMPKVQFLYLKGCFQLTNAGIERARTKLTQCQAIAYPNGAIATTRGLASFLLPQIFRKCALAQANGSGSNLDDFVIV